ncbi:hypothetical protein [Candidatus Nitrosocosmicus hydrocola]|uniref:hypothetical protein n=1 Tax=Candidatus Nitrosocosmicus hydrocola TaxID=1826872 RepID=UPI00137361B3|nr:hypothetical protein [Candidatus Nitrosocosmicus hydrocola]
MDNYKQHDRTTIQVSVEIRKKLKSIEDFYDKPLIRVMKQIVNQEFEKLPQEIKMEVTA